MQVDRIFKLLFVIMLVWVEANGQIKITTLKGKIIETSEYKLDSTNGFVELRYLSTKGKSVFLDYDDVFSISNEHGQVSMIYRPTNQLELDVSSMEQYVNGQIESRKNGFRWDYFAASYLIGASGGFYEGNRIFIAPLVSMGATITFSFTFLDFKYKKRINQLSTNPNYISGHMVQSRRNRVKASILGSIAGLGSGAIIYGIRDAK